MHDEARKVFHEVAGKPHLDWPEAVWDAWVSFEQLYGSPVQIDDALDRIRRAQIQVNSRRAKEAEKAQAQFAAETLITETQAAMEVPVPVPAHQETTPMDVDRPTPSSKSDGAFKRKADDDSPSEGNKKARIGSYASFIHIMLQR